jgi:hypothetical protein
MTIENRIIESKQSIKVPPFDFDKAFKRIEEEKGRRIPFFKNKFALILSTCTALTAIIFAVVIPIKSFENKTKTIEIGFEQNSISDIARPYESQFETMIKTDTKAEKVKNLEVFYGNYHFTDWNAFTFSKEQTLHFSLKRAVISETTGKVIFEKEIFNSEHDISYFFSRQFYSKENSFTDIVAYDDLSNYEDKGSLLYTFTIEPIDGDTFATVFVDDYQTTYGKDKNMIECYDERSISYILKDGLLEFLEPPKKENINE